MSEIKGISTNNGGARLIDIVINQIPTLASPTKAIHKIASDALPNTPPPIKLEPANPLDAIKKTILEEIKDLIAAPKMDGPTPPPIQITPEPNKRQLNEELMKLLGDPKPPTEEILKQQDRIKNAS